MPFRQEAARLIYGILCCGRIAAESVASIGVRWQSRIEAVQRTRVDFHLDQMSIRLHRIPPAHAARRRCPVVGITDQYQRVSDKWPAGRLTAGIEGDSGSKGPILLPCAIEAARTAFKTAQPPCEKPITPIRSARMDGIERR